MVLRSKSNFVPMSFFPIPVFSQSQPDDRRGKTDHDHDSGSEPANMSQITLNCNRQQKNQSRNRIRNPAAESSTEITVGGDTFTCISRETGCCGASRSFCDRPGSWCSGDPFETTRALAGGGEATGLAVLVDGGNDPVDAGVAADCLVLGVDCFVVVPGAWVYLVVVRQAEAWLA